MLQISGVVSRPVPMTRLAGTPPTYSGSADSVSIMGALEKGIPGTMFGFLPAVGALTNHLGGKDLPALGRQAALVGTVANLGGLAAYMSGMPTLAAVGLVTSAVCSGALWAWRGAHDLK